MAGVQTVALQLPAEVSAAAASEDPITTAVASVTLQYYGLPPYDIV